MVKQRFSSRFALKSAPKGLRIGGPTVVSPNGKNTVRLVACTLGDGSPARWLKVVVSAGNTVLSSWDALAKVDYDLLWEPGGSRFAVIRSSTERREYYAAYDLRTGRHLRDESRARGKHRREGGR